MESIKDRAERLYCSQCGMALEYDCSAEETPRKFITMYIKIATEQKEIDDAELARLKKAWEKEAEVNHDADKAYKQGRHDAIDKACEWLKKYCGMNESGLVQFRKALEE